MDYQTQWQQEEIKILDKILKQPKNIQSSLNTIMDCIMNIDSDRNVLLRFNYICSLFTYIQKNIDLMLKYAKSSVEYLSILDMTYYKYIMINNQLGTTNETLLKQYGKQYFQSRFSNLIEKIKEELKLQDVLFGTTTEKCVVFWEIPDVYLMCTSNIPHIISFNAYNRLTNKRCPYCRMEIDSVRYINEETSTPQ